MAAPLTAIIIMVQPLVGAMIWKLWTMREEIPVLTFIVTRTAAVPIVTIISGLDHDTGIISAQMSWRFIMKCLLETGRQHKTKKAKKQTNKHNNNNHNKNINRPTKISHSKK